MALQALRGTSDLLADDVKRWFRVEHRARRLAALYGYQEIRTPLIEDAAVFRRSVGETTDIIQKEMFRVSRSLPSAPEDRGEQDMVLRPEGTASVVRAYLQHSLHKTQGFAKLFYLGPMFRAERPQAGRFRQFHQYGVEAIGSSSPWVDVEVIALCLHILRECGLPAAPDPRQMGAAQAGVPQPTLWIASMGCRKDQDASADDLRQRLAPQRDKLCKECQARCEKNVFRILDCKNPACHQLAWGTSAEQEGRGHSASPFRLCQDCRQHYDDVRQGLRSAGIRFDDTHTFARGLDYYTRTVFEVRAAGLGAQDAVAAGGRYDHLVEEFGGPSLGAVGFATGIERLLMAVEAAPEQPTPPAVRRGLYLALAEPSLVGEGFRVVQTLRDRDIGAAIDFDGKSLKGQFREADKALFRFVAVLGKAELSQRSITLKDLDAGSQRSVPLDALVDEVAGHANTSCH